jgi:hypothetical protein
MVHNPFHQQRVNHAMQQPQQQQQQPQQQQQQPMYVWNPQMMGFYGPQTSEVVFPTTGQFQPQNENAPPM